MYFIFDDRFFFKNLASFIVGLGVFKQSFIEELECFSLFTFKKLYACLK